MAWSGHILLTDPARLWHANAFYPEPLQLRVLRHPARLRAGRHDRRRAGRRARPLQHPLRAGPRARLRRRVRAGPAARRGPDRRGGGRRRVRVRAVAARARPATCTSSPPAASRWPWRCWPAGTAGRCGTATGRSAGTSGWALAGWLVAAWQLSLGFGIGLPFAYVLALASCVVAAVDLADPARRSGRSRRPFGRRLFVADVGRRGDLRRRPACCWRCPTSRWPSCIPYARRSVERRCSLYSPPLRGFFIAPDGVAGSGAACTPAPRDGLPWSAGDDPAAGLRRSTGWPSPGWSSRSGRSPAAAARRRCRWSRSCSAMGTWFFGGTATYLPLFEYLPGWDGLRAPRPADDLDDPAARRARRRRGVRVRDTGAWGAERAHTAGPGLAAPGHPAAAGAGAGRGLNTTPHPVVPTAPAAMRARPGADPGAAQRAKTDSVVMLWSTDGFPEWSTAAAASDPAAHRGTRGDTGVPDQASVDYLRELGVKTVVVLRQRADRHARRRPVSATPATSSGSPAKTWATRWSSGLSG